MDFNHAAGSISGAIIGSYKYLTAMIFSYNFISWEIVGDTALLAFIGGILGWLGAEVMKFTKMLILRYKNRKNDKNS